MRLVIKLKLEKCKKVKFEVLAVELLKIQIFWDAVLYLGL